MNCWYETPLGSLIDLREVKSIVCGVNWRLHFQNSAIQEIVVVEYKDEEDRKNELQYLLKLLKDLG